MSYFDKRHKEALQEARRRELAGFQSPVVDSELDEDLSFDEPTYGFKLRRKRANKIISQMLREGGYDDLARITNVSREEY